MSDDPNPVLKQIRTQNAKLRVRISQEILYMPQRDLLAVLRMIEQWKMGHVDD